MIPVRSRSDSLTFTAGRSAIGSKSNFSRCPEEDFCSAACAAEPAAAAPVPPPGRRDGDRELRHDEEDVETDAGIRSRVGPRPQRGHALAWADTAAPTSGGARSRGRRATGRNLRSNLSAGAIASPGGRPAVRSMLGPDQRGPGHGLLRRMLGERRAPVQIARANLYAGFTRDSLAERGRSAKEISISRSALRLTSAASPPPRRC